MSYYNPNAYGLTSSASINLSPINVPPVNRYIVPRGVELNAAITTLTNYSHARVNHIEYIPFIVDTETTYDRIGINYVNANSCVSTWYYDVALYSANTADRFPDTKLTDFGTFTIDPASTPTGGQLITINQTLQPNTLYFLAIGIRWSDNTDFLAGRSPFLTLLQGDYPMFAKRGLSNAAASTYGVSWFDSIGSYSGTLPSTTTYSSSVSVISVSPRLALRRSA